MSVLPVPFVVGVVGFVLLVVGGVVYVFSSFGNPTQEQSKSRIKAAKWFCLGGAVLAIIGLAMLASGF